MAMVSICLYLALELQVSAVGPDARAGSPRPAEKYEHGAALIRRPVPQEGGRGIPCFLPTMPGKHANTGTRVALFGLLPPRSSNLRRFQRSPIAQAAEGRGLGHADAIATFG